MHENPVSSPNSVASRMQLAAGPQWFLKSWRSSCSASWLVAALDLEPRSWIAPFLENAGKICIGLACWRNWAIRAASVVGTALLIFHKASSELASTLLNNRVDMTALGAAVACLQGQQREVVPSAHERQVGLGNWIRQLPHGIRNQSRQHHQAGALRPKCVGPGSHHPRSSLCSGHGPGAG